jgi:LuxR family transcriptional regulator, maltose regulon positive regulatory protein
LSFHALQQIDAFSATYTETLTLELLQDKITTPTELPRVSRERLNSTLDESLGACNSTIVMGRAGTGKTMLVRDFARRCGRRTAWYKVDAPDAELRVFFQYLCASMADARPGFGRKTLARVGEAFGPEDVPLLVEYFVYELLERDEPLLVVIDDLHLIYDADWVVPFFRRLLPLLPREVHVVLIGRSLPPAPLWRMRSKQTLCVIDEASLAFTTEEAEQLFESYGLPVWMSAAALDETRGRAHALDARARAFRVNEEAEKLVAERTESKRARTFQLVKGFNRKSSLGNV